MLYSVNKKRSHANGPAADDTLLTFGRVLLLKYSLTLNGSCIQLQLLNFVECDYKPECGIIGRAG